MEVGGGRGVEGERGGTGLRRKPPGVVGATGDNSHTAAIKRAKKTTKPVSRKWWAAAPAGAPRTRIRVRCGVFFFPWSWSPCPGQPSAPSAPCFVLILRSNWHASAGRRPTHDRRRQPQDLRNLIVRWILPQSLRLSWPRLRHQRDPSLCLWKRPAHARGQPAHAAVWEPCSLRHHFALSLRT